MTSLTTALHDTLLRRQPPPAGVDPALLQPLIAALIEALEQGELGLDLRQAALPEGCLDALGASGWLLKRRTRLCSCAMAPGCAGGAGMTSCSAASAI